MPVPQVFIIEVQNGGQAFFPGQTINGRVVLSCQEQKKLRGIYLTLVGRAYTHWTESRSSGSGDNRRTETVHYRDAEPYFDFRVNLWGGTSGKQFLQPGNYEWPFSFQLPSVPLPTSYEAHYGNIRYWLEARMDRPWKFDHVTVFPFTILERVDLNLSTDDLLAPKRAEGQKTLGCLCCKSGPITVAVSTDRSAYCSGEQILMTAHLENNSNKEVRGVKATLYRKVVFVARGRTRGHSEVVAKMQTTAGIRAGEVFEWNQQPLPIPACPPSSHTCRIVLTDYVIHVQVMMPTFSFDLDLYMPIVIGTEPLRSAYANSTVPAIGFTHTEAVNIAQDQFTMGQTQFAPMYFMVQPPATNPELPPPTNLELPPPTNLELPPPTNLELPPPTNPDLPPSYPSDQVYPPGPGPSGTDSVYPLPSEPEKPEKEPLGPP